ncbi:MAG TPA: hypothetical protein VKT82_35025 [Ktedonobacterales bacterium]|nr:hypothetical protein [Ktedonobacterales bacterium]
MTFESEPLAAQPQSDEPVLPEKPHPWAPPFRFLVALVALIGLAATLYSFVGKPIGSNPFYSSLISYVASANQAALVLNSVFVVVGVAGLWFTRSALLRTGLVLLAISSLGAILLILPVALVAFSSFQTWGLSFYSSFAFLYSSPFMPLFELALGLLGFLSRLCFSYGLARWQSSDKGYIWFQVVVTVGLGSIIFQTTSLPSGISWAFILELARGTYLGIAGLACVLLRPACWKASPLIVLCMTAGEVVLYLFDEVIQRFIHGPGAGTQAYQIASAISLGGATLVILGVLLLIQRARGQKEQKHALEGDLAHLGTNA